MKFQVEKRSVYEGGRRKRVVFDARCGEKCDCQESAKSRKAVLTAISATHEYVSTAPSVDARGCRLFAQGLNQWCFELRSHTPTAASMLFGAHDWIAAYEYALKCYSDHPDCQAFFEGAA